MSALLAHLAPRLSERIEDIAVEALGYILSSRAAMAALQGLLRETNVELPQLDSIRTQVTQDGTRPDLVGFGQDGTERLLVEAKFWAGLTDNQPNAYLERLPNDDQPAALLVIAPNARLETLWIELCRLADCPSAQAVGDPRSVAATEQHHLILTSWSALLDRMSMHADGQGELSTKADISQLSALCQRQDEEAFRPLRRNELAPEFPRRMLQLNRLIDDATELAIELGIATTQGLVRTPRAYGYGRYLKLGQADGNVWAGVWFGIHHELWVSCRETPIWLVFSHWSGTLRLPELRQRLGEDRRAGTSDNVPIHLLTGVERDAVLEDVVKQLAAIAESIAANH